MGCAKQVSVTSRSDLSLSEDLSPPISLLSNSHQNEKAKGCFPGPQQKIHEIWDTEPIFSLGKEFCVSEEVPDPYIAGWSFFQKGR